MRNRPDGRAGGGTLRPLACEMTCLSSADGSALWKAGSTHVLAAIYGPVAPRQPSKEQTKSIVTVLWKSGSLFIEREWESFLTEILMASIDLEHYPRSVIQIVLQVIQHDGSVLSCALHAAVAALLDAGIVLKRLPVATTCLLRDDSETASSSSQSPLSPAMQLDPVSDEEQEKDSSVIVVVNDNTNLDKMLGCYTMGTSVGISIETLLICLQAASRASPAVIAFWRLAVEQKVTRQSQTLWSS